MVTLLMNVLSSVMRRLFQDFLKDPRSLLVVFLRREDPQAIKQNLYRDEVRRISSQYKIGDHDASTGSESRETPYEKRYGEASLVKEAEVFEQRARRHWGRSSLRHRFRSAWLYALAGYCYQQSNDPRAVSQYHYAANAFRNVEAFEQSMEFYRKAADVAASAGNSALRTRSLMRALGVARMAGDLEREDSLRAELALLLTHTDGARRPTSTGGVQG